MKVNKLVIRLNYGKLIAGLALALLLFSLSGYLTTASAKISLILGVLVIQKQAKSKTRFESDAPVQKEARRLTRTNKLPLIWSNRKIQLTIVGILFASLVLVITQLLNPKEKGLKNTPLPIAIVEATDGEVFFKAGFSWSSAELDNGITEIIAKWVQENKEFLKNSTKYLALTGYYFEKATKYEGPFINLGFARINSIPIENEPDEPPLGSSGNDVKTIDKKKEEKAGTSKKPNTILSTSKIPIPEVVRIPGGTFTMGCLNTERDGKCQDDEKPAHEVTISTFSMGKYEVTNAEFVAFLNAKGDQEEDGTKWVVLEGIFWGAKYRIIKKGDSFEVESGYEQHPIIYVTWYGARAYAEWLSTQTGLNYRLPTEAEWEYAARGGAAGAKDEFLYSGSATIEEVAWHYQNSDSRTHPVGQKKQNQLGLYDMSGNVHEWCADWHGNYDEQSQTNPKGPSSGNYKVLRGGSSSSGIESCRLAARSYIVPPFYEDDIGFRIARD